MNFKGQYQSGYGGIGRHIGLRSQLLQVQLLLSGLGKQNMTTFHNLYQQIFTSLRGRESPTNYFQKVINTVPENRRDLNLQMQFENYKRIRHLLVLNNQERIALDMLLHTKDYYKMVNELPHLFLIAKLENSRGYLLKDFEEVNPGHHKMGDIFVPLKGQKYESKTYKRLGRLNIKDIFLQYEKNDFRINPVSFSIVFQDVFSNFSVEDFRGELSD